MKRKSAADFFSLEGDPESDKDRESSDSEQEDYEDQEDQEEFEDEMKKGKGPKRRLDSHSEGEDEDEEGDEDGDGEGEDTTDVSKPIDNEKVEETIKKIKRSGVIYISRIPPYMKPVKLRQILSRFGTVNRIYMTPEDPKAYARRVKYGGNKKKNYTEGWAEYTRKSDAKLAAATLNGNKIGGKKGSYYYDDIMSILYLPKFKWHNLTEQMALEKQLRQERMKAEVLQARRENKVFVENVERNKMIKNIQSKKKDQGSKDQEVRRSFEQRKVVNKRAKTEQSDSKPKKLSSLLGKVL